MKLNSILSVFTPKDTKFVPLLNETAEVLTQAAALLEELFSSANPTQVKELCTLIKSEETKGDRITAKISKELNNTFITPFDREDIDTLADVLDDAIDAINRSAQKVLLYSPRKLPPTTAQLASIVKNGAIEVQKAVSKLNNIANFDQEIRGITKEIKKLEEKADTVYELAIMDLFQEEQDAVELIKLKEIIQELEKSVNRVNRIGKVLKTIIVKYA